MDNSDRLEKWAISNEVNKVYGPFKNEDQASGFAYGLTTADNDSFDIPKVLLDKKSMQWYVCFMNYDDEATEIYFTFEIDSAEYDGMPYDKCELEENT